MYSLEPAEDKPDRLSLVIEPKFKPTFLNNPTDGNGAPTKWDPKELAFNKSSLWAPKSLVKARVLIGVPQTIHRRRQQVIFFFFIHQNTAIHWSLDFGLN